MPPTQPRQLALALGYAENLTREDFLPAPSNQSALAMIERWPDWPDRVLALVGPQGCGKSHLAAIWAETAGARMLSARMVTIAALSGALATGALVLEDCSADDVNERALFHLLNMLREDNGWLLLTSRSAPVSWNIALPDLASRLRAIPVVSIDQPDDTLLRAALVKMFSDRQLAVDEALVSYLLTHRARSLAAMREAVQVLDREGLQRGRPVNRALAADLLREEGRKP